MESENAEAVQLHLPKGVSRGVRVARKTGYSVEAIRVHRSETKSLQDIEYPISGVYFLLNEENDLGRPKAYIGETINFKNRIRNHSSTKDFWKHAVIVHSKDFDKADCIYLEKVAIKNAESADRFKVDNKDPSRAWISSAKQNHLNTIFKEFRIFLSVLGVPIFEPLRSSSPTRTLKCSGKGVQAEGEYTDDGLVVFKESEAVKELADHACDTRIEVRRRNLIDEKILEERDGCLVFTKDHAFDSPTAAATTVLGGRESGKRAWVDDQGNTLRELEQQ